MARALVLSGGGSRGSFQAGVLTKLSTLNYDAVYGTSAGALNATLFSYLNTENIESTWSQINSIDDVFQFNGLNAVWSPGLYNNSLLIAKAFAIVSSNPAKMPVTVTVTSLRSGTVSYSNNSLPAKDFAVAVANSATIPGLCCNLNDTDSVDGGVVANIPIEQAILDGYDEITVVLAMPYSQKVPPDAAPASLSFNLPEDISYFVPAIGALIRSLEIMFNVAIWGPIQAALPLCKSLTVYAPDISTANDSFLDFSAGAIMAGIAQGKAALPLILK